MQLNPLGRFSILHMQRYETPRCTAQDKSVAVFAYALPAKPVAWLLRHIVDRRVSTDGTCIEKSKLADHGPAESY